MNSRSSLCSKAGVVLLVLGMLYLFSLHFSTTQTDVSRSSTENDPQQIIQSYRQQISDLKNELAGLNHTVHIMQEDVRKQLNTPSNRQPRAEVRQPSKWQDPLPVKHEEDEISKDQGCGVYKMADIFGHDIAPYGEFATTAEVCP